MLDVERCSLCVCRAPIGYRLYSYGGIFHCIPCRCSIRWLLRMWAQRVHVYYCYGRRGQLYFSKGSFSCCMVNQISPLHVRQALQAYHSGLLALISSPTTTSECFSFIFLLCLSWACVVSSSTRHCTPHSVKRKECKWTMRVKVCLHG